MARPWAVSAWKAYLPKLYAGQRPADFAEYREQVIESLRRPGYAKAFSLTTRTSHDPAEARLADVSAPTIVVMGERDPDFPDPRAEADWIAQALRGEVAMVPEAGHYPQSQQPEITPTPPCIPGEGDRTCLGLDSASPGSSMRPSGWPMRWVCPG